MTSATIDTSDTASKASVRDRVVDSYRHAAHLSHEARLLKSVATDAVEDGVHAAKRAIISLKRRVEELADLKDEAAHRVKRQPLRTVGIALGVGLVVGMAIGWIGRRPGRRE